MIDQLIIFLFFMLGTGLQTYPMRISIGNIHYKLVIHNSQSDKIFTKPIITKNIKLRRV